MNELVLRLFFGTIISWLTGLSTDGFSRVVNWVRTAEGMLSDGAQRAAWVKENIAKVFEITAPWLLSVITEVAVAFATRKGYINAGG
jgi:hypothetical protein